MAVSWTPPANWFQSVADPTVTVSFAAGDTIVVFGGTESSSTTLGVPTATGLTFTLRSSVETAPGSESAAYIWTATAGAAGTNVVITSARGGPNGTQQAGIGAWVVTDPIASITALAGTNTEAAYSATVAAGDIVMVALADFEANNPPGKAPLTGSGTATERADTGNTTNYAVWVADWYNTAAGTFSFGPDGYALLIAAQVGVVLTPSASGTIDQEGFRFYADGTEAGAVATQAQDVSDTAAVGDLRILRILLNATGDLPSFAPTLRARKNGTGGYVPVPVGPSVAEAFGTVTFGAIGTGANGSTTVAPSYPTGITAGDYLTCVVTSGATNSETPTTPSGWTLLATGASTDGTFGVDTGPRRATVFGKVADGTETGTLTVSITNGNTCRGTITRWTKTGGDTWDVVGVGGDDSTSGTGVSIAFPSVNWHDGDAVLVATGQRVDSATQSAQSLTATGITFGTRTNRAATAVTTGNDIRHTVDTFAAVSGAATSEDSAPTWAYTGSAAVSAGGVLVRLRAYTAPVTNQLYVAASGSIAAGGEATTARETPPAGKTTGQFLAGRIWDDENGVDTLSPATDQWTVVGWVLDTQAPAVNGDFWDFQVYEGSSPVDTYSALPRLTMGTGGGTAHDRTGGDGATASDVGARTQGGARSRAETSTAADAGARSSAQARSATDGSTAADAASHQLSKTALAAESATAGDTGARVAATTRSRAETPTASDVGARVAGQARAATDTSTAADAATAAEAAARSRADSSTASDSGARVQGAARTRAETATATGASSRSGAALRASAETATATDSATHELIVGGQLSSSAADGSTATDGGARVATQSRAQADASTAADARTRTSAQARSQSETSTASDAGARSGGFARSRAETATATDGATHQLILGGVAHSRTASDVSIATDTASRVTTGLRSPVEAAVALDVMVRTLTALRALQEAASASDGFLAVLDGGVRADVAVCVLLVRARGTAELLPSASARLLEPPTAELLRKCC